MFRIPQKKLIVNVASQLNIKKYDGSATYVDIVSPALLTDGFWLEGFLQPVLFGSLKAVVSTTLIKSTAGSTGNKQVATYVASAITGDASGAPFVVQYQAQQLAPVEFQNQPLQKHYTLSATLGVNPANTAVATAIGAAINADKNAPVTASVASATVTLTAKDAGVDFLLFGKVTGLIAGTFTVTTAASQDINTYDVLKNINWSKSDQFGNYDVDRNAEQFPLFGSTYKSYRFILKSTPFNASMLVPSQKPSEVDTEFEIWIANGLTLQTTMDLVVADANSAT